MAQTPVTLVKGWNTRLPEDTLSKDFIEIHRTASRFRIMLYKVKQHTKQSINYAFDYEKQKWDKSHKVPDRKVGDLVIVSTLNFNNIKSSNKLKSSYEDPFLIVSLHAANAVQVKFSG
ncbi:hypothetical protein O181_120375 [Austropuccinia psidii MF-1]|uniref:Uncharacterized protein n=1 Tax=Austropuccinia psidii MF-1 TaxID=1389203 RepID=A0A9Q3KK18_9BASI|nr:hypothetical protein [Austropuccinia psidii MF-1]